MCCRIMVYTVYRRPLLGVLVLTSKHRYVYTVTWADPEGEGGLDPPGKHKWL